MELYEIFGIAAFRSRQQVINYHEILKRMGIKATIISTPRELSIGCGLSVRFNLQDMDKAIHEYKWSRPSTLIGFYKIERRGSHSFISPIRI
ncbi:MAG: DUF3343 domain-containing protein [Clostridia bacterium]|jgi:hypothetical protein